MLKLNCPSCGAEVPFKSKASVFAVCSFCKSTLVRKDQDLSLIGKMSELQDELTPFQIGTSGMYDGNSFELVGRLRVSYLEGFWNEWFALFSDGREAWLAEAQGFLAICLKIVPKELPSYNAMQQPGYIADLSPHGTYIVDDIRFAHCEYSEGELPVAAVQGRSATSVDLSSADGRKMATIEFAPGETRAFAGEYLDFDEFKFRNLRKLDGW